MAFWNRFVGGNFSTKQVEMGNSAVRIVGAWRGRGRVTLVNMGTTDETVYVGPTDQVSSSTGTPIFPGASQSFVARAAIYGIAASGTPKIAVTDEGASTLGGLLNE